MRASNNNRTPIFSLTVNKPWNGSDTKTSLLLIKNKVKLIINRWKKCVQHCHTCQHDQKMIKYTPKPLTKYPWVSISRCPNLASQGQHFGRRNPFSRSSMLALCDFRIKWHNSIQIRSKIFRIFSKFARTLNPICI